MTKTMIEQQVTKEEFYTIMNPLDVIPYPKGNYPYETLWKLRNYRIVGRSKEENYYIVN